MLIKTKAQSTTKEGEYGLSTNKKGEHTNALLTTHGGSKKKQSWVIIHFYHIPQSPKSRYQQR